MTRENTISKLIELGIDNPIATCPYGTDRINLIGRNLAGIDLSGMYLSDARLNGADLSNANLSNTVLTGSDLSLAVLHDVSLWDTILDGARLNGADLNSVTDIKDQREVIAEILRQAAGEDVKKLSIAGLILVTDKCWNEWETLKHPARKWAIKALCSNPAWGLVDTIGDWQ